MVYIIELFWFILLPFAMLDFRRTKKVQPLLRNEKDPTRRQDLLKTNYSLQQLALRLLPYQRPQVLAYERGQVK